MGGAVLVKVVQNKSTFQWEARLVRNHIIQGIKFLEGHVVGKAFDQKENLIAWCAQVGAVVVSQERDW